MQLTLCCEGSQQTSYSVQTTTRREIGIRWVCKVSNKIFFLFFHFSLVGSLTLNEQKKKKYQRTFNSASSHIEERMLYTSCKSPKSKMFTWTSAVNACSPRSMNEKEGKRRQKIFLFLFRSHRCYFFVFIVDGDFSGVWFRAYVRDLQISSIWNLNST